MFVVELVGRACGGFLAWVWDQSHLTTGWGLQPGPMVGFSTSCPDREIGSWLGLDATQVESFMADLWSEYLGTPNVDCSSMYGGRPRGKNARPPLRGQRADHRPHRGSPEQCGLTRQPLIDSPFHPLGPDGLADPDLEPPPPIAPAQKSERDELTTTCHGPVESPELETRQDQEASSSGVLGLSISTAIVRVTLFTDLFERRAVRRFDHKSSKACVSAMMQMSPRPSSSASGWTTWPIYLAIIAVLSGVIWYSFFLR